VACGTHGCVTGQCPNRVKARGSSPQVRIERGEQSFRVIVGVPQAGRPRNGLRSARRSVDLAHATESANRAEKVYPIGSFGDGYHRAMKLRAAERAAKGKVRSKEQEKRDDWPRA